MDKDVKEMLDKINSLSEKITYPKVSIATIKEGEDIFLRATLEGNNVEENLYAQNQVPDEDMAEKYRDVMTGSLLQTLGFAYVKKGFDYWNSAAKKEVR